jgi:ABC-type lipoprotein export system ATPase subunit
MSNAVNHIEARDLRRTYHLAGVAIEVLRGVSVDVRRGETLAITGQSGAGKSTLLHLLGGLDQPSAGTVHFDGADLFKLSARARVRCCAGPASAMCSSPSNCSPSSTWPTTCCCPRWASRAGAGGAGRSGRGRWTCWPRWGWPTGPNHKPLELSGGEQQRVAIARALMNDPEIVLADEPTGNLDSLTGQRVLDYLFDLTQSRGHTLVLVTHNEAVAGVCQRRLHLKDGQLA